MNIIRTGKHPEKFQNLDVGDIFTIPGIDHRVFIKMQNLDYGSGAYWNAADLATGDWTYVEPTKEVNYEPDAVLTY